MVLTATQNIGRSARGAHRVAASVVCRVFAGIAETLKLSAYCPNKRWHMPMPLSCVAMAITFILPPKIFGRAPCRILYLGICAPSVKAALRHLVVCRG